MFEKEMVKEKYQTEEQKRMHDSVKRIKNKKEMKEKMKEKNKRKYKKEIVKREEWKKK